MRDAIVTSGAEILLPQCSYCVHRRTAGDKTICTAFPSGVPATVLKNQADHRKPIDGDGGVRFEPRPDVDPSRLAMLATALDNGGKFKPEWM